MKRFFSAPNILRSLLRDPQPDSRLAADADPQLAAEAAKDRGNAFLGAGEFDQAALCYKEALRIQPSYAEAYVNLGIVVRQQAQARIKEAETMFARAASLKPGLWQAYFNLGIVAEDMNRPDEAIACYQHVLGMRPSYLENCSRPEVHWRLAGVYASQKRYDDALRVAKEIVAHTPSWVEVQCCVGVALGQLGRYDEALKQFERVVSMDSQNAEAIYCLGAFHQKLHHWEDARDCYARACALDQQHFKAQTDRAFILLLLGDYENGWAEYEKVLPHLFLKTPHVDVQAFRRKLTQEKYWDGCDLDGGTLLVWSEHGMGDNLMMLRYLPLIRGRGAGKIIIFCEQPLVRIVQNLCDADEVVAKSGKTVELSFDRHCSMMSLPYLSGTRLDTIPNRVPYLSVPEPAKACWKTRVAILPGLKVGLVWAGNPQLAADAARSVPLRKFAPLFALSGISWINLQKGEPAEQLKEVAWPIHDWMDECQDFQDTGALIEHLDLVITVDTSVVHLAGALGRPTWLLNRHESEWRWLLDREDSPWYPTVRIFRQPVAGDWDSVIERMADELRALTHF